MKKITYLEKDVSVLFSVSQEDCEWRTAIFLPNPAFANTGTASGDSLSRWLFYVYNFTIRPFDLGFQAGLPTQSFDLAFCYRLSSLAIQLFVLTIKSTLCRPS